ncbi:MAG: hypothetical protein EOO48_10170 [Flavobacterium sp.]|nr:MAG: hypothetical protein EOO48_10170 [Flavobacterium sp.]
MRNKLSADPSALILGIVGLVIILPGCCCGLFNVFALILCIIGLIMADKSLKEYDQNPDAFDLQTRSNVKSGKIVCIVGLVISALILLFYLVCFAIYGTVLSDVLKKNYYNTNNQYQVQDTVENYQDFGYHDSIPKDTISIDTSAVHVEPIK